MSVILILGGLAGVTYSVWRLGRRARGRGDRADHPQLRVVAIASVSVFTVGVALGVADAVRDSPELSREYERQTTVGGKRPSPLHRRLPVAPQGPRGPQREGGPGGGAAAGIDPLREIDAILEGLPLATVAFNVPTRIALGESAVIELLLSTRAPTEDLKREITEAGKRIGARIRISDRMEARLTGPRFKIEAITPEVQAISGSEVTSWRWEVEPTVTGRPRLHLTLSAILDVRGSPSTRTVRTFQRTLVVDVSLSDRVANFLQGNWQWLWTAILVPVAAWLMARHKRQAPGGPQGGGGGGA
ncbi:MAG: hypothetical protein M3N47_07240 [Chloroflexota bacterium]|nr:hypothetical protein [Chloroflexota bacterium]